MRQRCACFLPHASGLKESLRKRRQRGDRACPSYAKRCRLEIQGRTGRRSADIPGLCSPLEEEEPWRVKTSWGPSTEASKQVTLEFRRACTLSPRPRGVATLYANRVGKAKADRHLPKFTEPWHIPRIEIRQHGVKPYLNSKGRATVAKRKPDRG